VAQPPEKSKPPASRKDRLAEALRLNLQRRKAQSRARAAGEVEGGDSGDQSNDPPETRPPEAASRKT